MRALTILLVCGLMGCGGDPQPLEPTYENIEMTINLTCGARSSSCHGGARGNADLNFQRIADTTGDYTEVLVGVAACEYDFMPRVDPGNPDNSWLMVKLTGEHDSEGRLQFTPDPGWDPGLTPRMDGSFPPSQCPLVEDGELSFGYVMPENQGGTEQQLDARTTQLFRDWILAGAPGPS